MTLKELRTAKGLTLSRLAKLAGTTPASLSRYETGARQIPLKKARVLAEIFGVPWPTLYDESEPPASANQPR